MIGRIVAAAARPAVFSAAALAALLTVASPASARVFFGIGFGGPVFAPGPYFAPPPPPVFVPPPRIVYAPPPPVYAAPVVAYGAPVPPPPAPRRYHRVRHRPCTCR
ncbi:MAG: hypothetical protein JO267_15870 [Alphaproteobacteria bacterium]|nr:hypothetical protein [Alphaproteobacteria bacterium]